MTVTGQEPTVKGQEPIVKGQEPETKPIEQDKGIAIAPEDFPAVIQELRRENGKYRTELRQLQEAEADRQKKSKEADEKRLESQKEFETLANERKTELEKANSEITTYKAELEAQTAVLSALYESRKSLVPEMFRPLLDSMDLVKRLQWIAENESKLKPASNGVHGIPHTPNPKGTGDLTPEQRRARAKSTW